MSYNGWKNYETWSVHLHFFDGFDREGIEYSADMVENHVQTCVESSVAGGSFAMMLVQQFLHAVDWQEIANAINEN